MVYIDDHPERHDLQAMLATVSSQRQAYALRYRRETDRRLSLVAYKLLQHALEVEYGISEPPLFEYGAHGKPTIVGPYTENFRPVMSDLLAGEAIVQVQSEDELKGEVLRFFGDARARAALGARAEEAVRRRCGVVGRCADELLAALKGENAL